jgi:tRNA(Leu) C34 or U34 (ribose-2'-O)-methylase TrmL
VVIEVHYRARSLTSFTHPESAFYIFGPEDGSVRKEIVERVPLIVQIPAGCLNLAAAVNVVLYDRLAKSSRK